MEESALANSPFGTVPAALIPNILRFTDFNTQKAFSESCKTFNKWAHICSKTMYEEDGHRRNTQQAILVLWDKKIKSRDLREQKKLVKEMEKLDATVSSEKMTFVNIYSTLFARTFAQAVEKNPGRFLQNGRPSQTVLAVFYWMPEKIIKAIDTELDCPHFKRVLSLIEIHKAGKLVEFVAENREEFEEAYKEDVERSKLLDDCDTNSSLSESENSMDLDNSLTSEDSMERDSFVEVDDKTLYDFALKIVEINIRAGALKKHQELLELKDEFAKKVSIQTSANIQLEEPEVNSGPSSPRSP